MAQFIFAIFVLEVKVFLFCSLASFTLIADCVTSCDEKLGLSKVESVWVCRATKLNRARRRRVCSSLRCCRYWAIDHYRCFRCTVDRLDGRKSRLLEPLNINLSTTWPLLPAGCHLLLVGIRSYEWNKPLVQESNGINIFNIQPACGYLKIRLLYLCTISGIEEVQRERGMRWKWENMFSSVSQQFSKLQESRSRKASHGNAASFLDYLLMDCYGNFEISCFVTSDVQVDAHYSGTLFVFFNINTASVKLFLFP